MSKKPQHCYLYEIAYLDENDMLCYVRGRCWGYTPKSAKDHAERMFKNRFGEILKIDMINVGRITTVYHRGKNR